MVQSDIVELLKTYGFADVRLKKSVKKVHDYTFSGFKKAKLDKGIGHPSVTADGKVLIYNLAGVAKLGVCPSTNLLRFQDLTKEAGVTTETGHLSFVKVPDALTQGFYRAQGTPSSRISYMIALWKFLNKDKFGGKMKLPKLQLKTASKNTRGQYWGPIGGSGSLGMAPYMFEAREPFFLEVFLHEMCHQYVVEILQDPDMSERGHGPSWQRTMVMVGLDPRRFDPTDAVEYMPTREKLARDKEYEHLGPRVPDDYFKKHKQITAPKQDQPVAFIYHGRATSGEYDGLLEGLYHRIMRSQPESARKVMTLVPKSTKFYEPQL